MLVFGPPVMGVNLLASLYITSFWQKPKSLWFPFFFLSVRSCFTRVIDINAHAAQDVLSVASCTVCITRSV